MKQDRLSAGVCCPLLELHSISEHQQRRVNRKKPSQINKLLNRDVDELLWPLTSADRWLTHTCLSAVQLPLCRDSHSVSSEDTTPGSHMLARGGERGGGGRLQGHTHHPVRGKHLPLEHRRRAGGDRPWGAHQVNSVVINNTKCQWLMY